MVAHALLRRIGTIEVDMVVLSVKAARLTARTSECTLLIGMVLSISGSAVGYETHHISQIFIYQRMLE